MASNVIFNYIAIDKFTATSRRVDEALKNNQKKVEGLAKKFQKLGKRMSDLGKGGILKITAPILAVSGFALKAAADLETMEVGFRSMLGSEEKAAKLTKDLLDFTAKTPFQLGGVAGATKKLLAFGVANKDVLPTMEMLGDISAGSGKNLEELAAIFGKVKVKNKAMTEEINMLAEAGVPIIDILAEGFKITGAEVLNMASKGQISFDVIQKALAHTTAEGGVFNKAMIMQSKTMAGVWSTLKDNVNISLGALGTQIEKTFNLKDLMNRMIVGLQKLTVWFENLSPAARKWVVLGAGIAAILPPLIIGLGSLAIALGTMAAIAPFVSAGFGMMGAGIAFMFSPIFLLGAAIAILGGLFIYYFDDITLAASDLMESLAKVWSVITLAVSDAFTSIGSIIDGIIDRIMGKISVLMNRAAGIAGLGSALMSGDLDAAKTAGLQILSGADLTSQSTSDVNINLNDPGKQVRSVESQTVGDANLNLGSNVN